MMRTSDRIATTKQRATTRDALAGLKAIVTIDNADEAFALALEEACQQGGIDFAFAYSHAANETDFYRDPDFTRDKNPAGIGHPDNALGGVVFESFRAGARFYVGELLLKLRKPIPPLLSDARSHAPAKWDQVERIVGGSLGTFPNVERIKDLNQRFGPIGSDGKPREATWMTDAGGPQAIVDKGNALFPDLPDQQTGGTVTHTTVVPGLPGGPLRTDYPVIVDLIPASMTLNRPGTKAKKPRRSIQHGNGNPSSSARGERNFLHAGAPNNSGKPQKLSYHATGDDSMIYVLVPLDEVTWQAADGSGTGNHNGYSFELVEDRTLWANTARRDRAIHMAADFMGRVAARFAIFKPERHWDANWVLCCSQPCETQCSARHHCPDLLMDTGLWSSAYAPQWQAARLDELNRMGGVTTTTTTTPPPAPAKPKLPKGMSISVARRLFNPNDLRKPGGGRISFNPSGEVSRAWLVNALATIPEGAAWTEGIWDGLDTVIRRGDGRIVYAFGNFTYEQDAP